MGQNCDYDWKELLIAQLVDVASEFVKWLQGDATLDECKSFEDVMGLRG